jgi:hypothetical protein
MKPADRAALETLRKAAQCSVPEGVWAEIAKQADEVGILGLTGTARSVVESIVNKHGSPGDKSYAAMHPSSGSGTGKTQSLGEQLRARRQRLPGNETFKYSDPADQAVHDSWMAGDKAARERTAPRRKVPEGWERVRLGSIRPADPNHPSHAERKAHTEKQKKIRDEARVDMLDASGGGKMVSVKEVAGQVSPNSILARGRAGKVQLLENDKTYNVIGAKKANELKVGDRAIMRHSGRGERAVEFRGLDGNNSPHFAEIGKTGKTGAEYTLGTNSWTDRDNAWVPIIS